MLSRLVAVSFAASSAVAANWGPETLQRLAKPESLQVDADLKRALSSDAPAKVGPITPGQPESMVSISCLLCGTELSTHLSF
jgi:hypothetical protein